MYSVTNTYSVFSSGTEEAVFNWLYSVAGDIWSHPRFSLIDTKQRGCQNDIVHYFSQSLRINRWTLGGWREPSNKLNPHMTPGWQPHPRFPGQWWVANTHKNVPPALLTNLLSKLYLHCLFTLTVGPLPRMSPVPERPSWWKPQCHWSFHDCTVGTRCLSFLTVVADAIETSVSICKK